MDNRVLLVDDEPQILSAIKRILRKQGIEVLTAPNGESALQLMETYTIPVVLSDYRMPGMSGTELLTKIEARWPETVRMIISGHSDFDTVLDAIQTGVVHKFLAKPWSNEELLIQVVSALAQSSGSTFDEPHDGGDDDEDDDESPQAPVHGGVERYSNIGEVDAHLHAVLNTVQDGMVTINAKGVMLAVNPALEKIFGYSVSELLMSNVSMLMPTSYRVQHDGFLASYQPPGRKGVVGSLRRLVGLRKNGEVFPIELSVNEMAVNGERQFLGVIRDISDTVKAERENQLLLEALESCKDGFALFAPGGRLLRCNQRFRELYSASGIDSYEGITYEDFFRRCIAKGMFPRAQGYPDRWLQQLLSEHGGLSMEREVEVTSGRWLQLSESRTRNGGVIAFHYDVTHKKRAELALQQALVEAEEANSAKGRFLAMMSHEIRTPLNGVLGLLQLLDASELSQQQRSYVESALNSGRSLLAIISDILDFSKIEADKMELVEAPCSLTELMRDLRHLFGEMMGGKGLAYRVLSDPRLPEAVMADRQRLRQVLVNLIGNAAKFTDEGEVALAIQPTADGKIRFEITDTGIGIAEDDQAKLFTEFSTVRKKPNRTYEGTGLGLTISQRLVRLMGGELQVDSTVGKGSRFWFEISLNAVEAPKVAIERDKTMPGAHLAGEVLLVEDGPTNRVVAKAMLESAGLKVTCAEDGEKAVEICMSRGFDLVFMDISLPGMSGVETTHVLREIDTMANTPVVALTAYAMPGDRERFLAEGMDDYLEKPLDKQKLLALAGSYLGERASSAVAAGNGAGNAESAEAAEKVSLIEPQQLHQLAKDTSYEMVPELVDIFCADVKQRLGELSESQASGHQADNAREIVERHLHTIGSSSALYGLQPLHKEARRLEALCAQEFDQVAQVLPAFMALCEQSVLQLKAAMSGLVSPQ